MMTARAIAIGSKEQAATVPYHKYQPARFGLVSVCGVVWCGVVWCGVVWCGVVWCGVVWCGVVWCGVVRACGQETRGFQIDQRGRETIDID
jgi:hypothetical protein